MTLSKFKLTKLEKSWVMYDVGNSAFTLLITTILPIYFNSLATAGGLSETQYLAYWSYSASVTTLIVAFSAPILGAISDKNGRRKPIFIASLVAGITLCAIMGFIPHWLGFLAVLTLAKAGYSASIVFSDSMLPDVTSKDRMDVVSSYGYAFGYIGSCIPFAISIAIVLFAEQIGISSTLSIQIAIFITIVWWLLCSFPIIKNYKQTSYTDVDKGVIRDSFKDLLKTTKEIIRNKKVLLFLIAFLFYIDGVYTIISISTAYGEAIGLDSTALLLALLVTQIIAFPSAIYLGRLSRKFKSELIITLCIMAYLGIAVFAIFLDTEMEFWILAVMVGLFQGTIQALSRSYFAKIIPAEKSGKYFSFLDIFGKGASFMGTFLFGLVADVTGQINMGVLVLVGMFILGLFFFRVAIRE